MSEENYTSQHPELQDDYLAEDYPLPYLEPPELSSPDFSQQPPQAAPTEIDQLVAKHQLGRVELEYENEVSRTMTAGILSCLIGLIGFIFVLFFLSIPGAFVPTRISRDLGWLTIFVGSGSLIYGINRITIAINNTASNLLHHSPQIYLCTQGVLSIKGKQVQAIRWDQVSTVQKISAGDSSNIIRQYILYPSEDKEPVVLDKVVARFKILGLQIEREVARHLLPKVITAYKAGETLNFGAIDVTSQGLSLKEEQKSIPWEKIGDVGEHEGYLIIREKGTLSTLAEIDLAKMLNLCIFPRLIKQLRNDYTRRRAEQKLLSYQPPTDDTESEWQAYE